MLPWYAPGTYPYMAPCPCQWLYLPTKSPPEVDSASAVICSDCSCLCFCNPGGWKMKTQNSLVRLRAVPSGHCSVRQHALKVLVLVCQKFPMHRLVLCVSSGRVVVVHPAQKITSVLAASPNCAGVRSIYTVDSMVAQLPQKMPSEWS